LIWYRILAFLRGYLVLTVYGNSLVKLVNLAMAEGIYLWDLQRPGKDLIRVKVGVSGLRALRPLLQRTKSRARIRRRRGLPFLLQKILRRRFWLAGMFLTIIALFFFSGMILFVQIDGVKDTDGRLFAELKQYGVGIGARRNRIIGRMEEIERRLRINHPELLWVDVELKGVLFRLRVIPRKVPPAASGPADLVARKDGRITRLTVVQGTPQVKEGDIVARGDLLIAGYSMIKDLDGSVFWRELPAKGRVEAVVGYEVTTMEPLDLWVVRPLKNRKTVFWLRWRGRLYPIFSWGKIKSPALHCLQRKCLKTGRNPWDLVELIKDDITEVKWEHRRLSVPEALARARAACQQSLRRQVPDKTKPQRVWEDWRQEGRILYYRRVVEVVEEISGIRRREKESGSGIGSKTTEY